MFALECSLPLDICGGDQLRQRAAMGGERERAELAAFEALLSKCIADALVAEVRKEAEVHGVDVMDTEHRPGRGLHWWRCPSLPFVMSCCSRTAAIRSIRG